MDPVPERIEDACEAISLGSDDKRMVFSLRYMVDSRVENIPVPIIMLIFRNIIVKALTE